MNPNEIVLLDLFSGIGGFAEGLSQAGFAMKEHYFSEIDTHLIANYQYNFPHAKYLGSVTAISGSAITKPTIITFGSPCQDFSLAGKRVGMDGQRSSLILEAIRLISECKPSVFIWENVKGTFSSNHGQDFWAIINAFANIGGYRIEWQLLNTKWFLPQNRERIYLIGHLDGASKPGVFPFREDDFGITDRFSGSSIVRTITAGGHSGGLHSGMTLLKTNCNQIASAPNQSLLYWKNSKEKWVEDFRESVPCIKSQSDLNRSTLIKNLNQKQNFGKATKQQDRVYDTNGIMACLGSHRLDDKVKICVAQRGGRKENEAQHIEQRKDEITNTITSVQKDNMVLEGQTIRRLTEIECERLQGFADNWTRLGNYNGTVKEVPKTYRYKMCGNAVSVPVVKEVGKRLIVLNKY